jgi:hypothetical protein
LAAHRLVRLGLVKLNHHGYVGGAPDSGKATLLRLLVQGFAAQ